MACFSKTKMSNIAYMSAYENIHQVGQEVRRHRRQGHVGPPELVCQHRV